MPFSNLSSNFSVVNPEDFQHLLRDYADCKKQLASERRQSTKLRAENKGLKGLLEMATRSEKWWMLRAKDAMHEGQLLREEKLGIFRSKFGGHLIETVPN